MSKTALSETKRYQPYPEYKDSGVEWLEVIPSHWLQGKIKHISTNLDFRRIPLSAEERGNRQGEYPYYGASGAIDSVDGYLFDEYTILFGEDGANLLTKSTPLAFVASGKYWVNNHAHILKPLDEVYFFWVNSLNNLDITPVVSGSAQPKLTAEALGNLDIVYPPSIEERQVIANFLDHETAKIDTLIDKQQQLIKLLKEKRQAVISHAVTKGLNPNAPMKDSGVEWCDDIPEHWRIGKLGYFVCVSNGATPSRENKSFWNGGTIGWLNSSKVNDVIITEAEQFITPLALAQTSVQPVKASDLVIAITGEGQTRGRVAICQLEATINQHLASIRIYDDCLHHEFLFLWLSANYDRIRFESTGSGSTKGAITCGDIKSYPVVLAPLSEQLEIINHLELQNQRFSKLIAKAETQVQLLKERRTALISAAVTGKIDVRDFTVKDGEAPNSQPQAFEQTTKTTGKETTL